MDNEEKADKSSTSSQKPEKAIYFHKTSYTCAKKNTDKSYEKYNVEKKEVEPAIIFFDDDQNADIAVNHYETNLIKEKLSHIDIPECPEVPECKYSFAEYNKLYDATYATQKGVGFKGSIIKMKLNRFRTINKIHNSLESDKYKFDQPYQFTLKERGHERDIKAQTVKDRITLHSYNDNIVVPKTIPRLIYDNGASLEEKGVSFTRMRFKEQLIWAYRHWGPEFYILFIDFSKFFDNIDHQKCIDYFAEFLNPVEMEFFIKCMALFEVDVSYMEDEEIKALEKSVFNSLEYSNLRKTRFMNDPVEATKLYNRSTMMRKSVDIGNHLSQMIGVYYPHEIDNYCKIRRQIHCYNRYMDDTAIMMRTKEELMQLLAEIEPICERTGLHINKKKTRIANPCKDISTFLKINYIVEPETGRIIEKVSSETFRRERRRLPKLSKLVEHEIMLPHDFLNCYKSWRGSYIKFDSKKKIHEMDMYFDTMIGPITSNYIISKTSPHTFATIPAHKLVLDKKLKL